jgi:DNA-binding transcriptional regulator YhcF (GntR family)
VIPFRLTFEPGSSFYEQVVYAAKRAVVSGQMRPGDPFPSVRALSRELKINPNTAHKIILQLVEDGVLEVRPGIGTVVAEPAVASPTRTETGGNDRGTSLAPQRGRGGKRRGYRRPEPAAVDEASRVSDVAKGKKLAERLRGLPSGFPESVVAPTGSALEGQRDAKRVYEKTTRRRARDARQELHNAERATAPQR